MSKANEVKEVVIRKEYLRRLISGVRKQIEKDPCTIEAKAEYGDEVIIGKWLDAALLCDVVEHEILNSDGV